MKKTGFTLAEVLITLAIIGVVATMTLPALMTNTNEQQSKTGLKKMINTLTLAAETNSANNGFDYASITTNDTSTESNTTQSLYTLLMLNTNVDRATSLTTSGSNTALKTAGGTKNMGSNNFTVFFKDGTAISYNTSSLSTGDAAALQTDGVPYGIPVLVDTNGRKGPNALSNCAGNALTAEDDNATTSNCNSKSLRVIKDQFSVRLRGIYAVPNGHAARWAFDN